MIRIYYTGWQYRPKDVERVVATLPTPYLSGAPAEFLAAGNNPVDTVFMDAEKAITGEIKPPRNQANIGSCVGNGGATGATDRLYLNIAAKGRPEVVPARVAVEPSYAGGRVEIGGGRIGGDGSIGAWQADYFRKYGVLLMQVYNVAGQTFDLTTYSVSRCRDWGNRGVPDVLEPIAREHPIQDISLVDTEQALLAALVNCCPVVVCSNVGFGNRKATGVCDPSGTWNHCMVWRGVVTLPGGRVCVINENSWDEYLGGPITTKLASGRDLVLNGGQFLIDLPVAVRMIRQKDTFAYNDAIGWLKPLKTFRDVFLAA